MINFCFQGWVRGAKVTTAINAQGKTVDVSKLKSATLVKKLHKGELFILLADHLDDNTDVEIEIHDYDDYS
jgi:hypothetical protein